jgi:hypothetical protein
MKRKKEGLEMRGREGDIYRRSEQKGGKKRAHRGSIFMITHSSWRGGSLRSYAEFCHSL